MSKERHWGQKLKAFTAIITCSAILFFSGLTLATNEDKRADSPSGTEQKLEGIKVEFDYENYPEERELAYRAGTEYGLHEPYPLQKSHIGIFLYDIDNDGQKEILAYYNNPGHCGSHGCSFSVLKPLEGNQYKIILDMTVEDEIEILKSSNLGYQDILFKHDKPNKSRLWRWTGKKYDLYK